MVSYAHTFVTSDPTDPANAIIQTLVDTIKRERFTSGYKATDAEAFGILMAGYFSHDHRILEAASSALEDANFHTQAAQVDAMLAEVMKDDDDQPYDESMRRALFAKLREVYGKSLSQDDRLNRVSILAGRPVYTMSLRTPNPITVGEFRKVMSILDTLSK